MKPVAIDDAFFRGDALLLVEDALTGGVLRECWSGHAKAKRIVVREAGGHVGVNALVQAASERNQRHVFGLVDADFAPATTNAGPVFRTERHELENHLLDFDTLAKLSTSHGAIGLRALAHARATQMQSWMALRRTLVEMKRDMPGFPAHPSPEEIANLDAAAAWVQRSTHRSEVEGAFKKTWTKSHQDTLLRQYDAGFAHELTSDQWLTTFSGKELFRHVRAKASWRHELTTDADLAFAVAARWDTNSFPPLVTHVRDAIIRRCSL